MTPPLLLDDDDGLLLLPPPPPRAPPPGASTEAIKLDLSLLSLPTVGFCVFVVDDVVDETVGVNDFLLPILSFPTAAGVDVDFFLKDDEAAAVEDEDGLYEVVVLVLSLPTGLETEYDLVVDDEEEGRAAEPNLVRDDETDGL